LRPSRSPSEPLDPPCWPLPIWMYQRSRLSLLYHFISLVVLVRSGPFINSSLFCPLVLFGCSALVWTCSLFGFCVFSVIRRKKQFSFSRSLPPFYRLPDFLSLLSVSESLRIQTALSLFLFLPRGLPSSRRAVGEPFTLGSPVVFRDTYWTFAEFSFPRIPHPKARRYPVTRNHPLPGPL